ncbi:MAG TPA: cation:proton antiporter [Bacteroidales bacterium]|nr:cation:proton antiporter [Bacteroidales bacterium]HPF02756.1 cation:proton antiporter [Bacteroidales bacterium]HPJ59026.1 cation:proton antiporter [Bacteroidales bacterium]HPR13244.1 cation:proton antiporter [Bacteroidales bacterium]HRW84716.1 cation:proton antiporter [Bacteroidales bacterium]
MEFTLLKDIVVIFALSTLVNFVFTKFKIPTIAGYLVTGIIAGPYLLSLVNDAHNIELLAEVGVIFLLFTIGMEFSLKHLLRIRRIVFLGGFLQVTITAAAFYGASRLFNLEWKAALLFGFLMALSSSALVLKLLQERSEVTSNYGRTILGVLIFQDLLLAPLLLFTGMLAESSSNITRELLILSVKVIVILGVVYAGNKWLLPKLLRVLAMTKNQELFMISIFLICFAIALGTAKLGMSLAFGAFLAGLMISESEYSHNVFGNFFTIKDVFASFFFVSIGMLFDISFVGDNWQLVLLCVILVIVIKAIIAGGTGFILGHTLKGTILIGLALSQVGEFSFILARIGFDKQLLPDFYYHLFLVVAVITMSLTPFMMLFSPRLVRIISGLNLPVVLREGLFPLQETEIPDFRNHLVIIGKDPSALKLSQMASNNNIRHISIVFDPSIAREKMNRGDLVVYGDAVNEPILRKAHVDTADIVVVSVGSIVPGLAIIEKIRHLNNSAYILVRSTLISNVDQLYKAGADQVIPEKLELAIDLFNRVLLRRLVPQKEVNRIITHIRSTSLGEYSLKDEIHQPSILDEFTDINIAALHLEEGSYADGKSLVEIDLRKKTGVTLLAVKRTGNVLEHPQPGTILRGGDIAYVLGNPEQINSASEFFGDNTGNEG